MWGPTLKRALTSASAAFLLMPALAQAGTTTATANAVTVRPLSIVRTADLEFGALVPGATAGTAIVNANTDARTTAGGVVGATGATPSAAHFATAGLANVLALITLPTTITLTRGGGSETMTVTAITTNGPTLRLFPGAGAFDVAVGGTLGVGANQVAGSYAGTFSVTVNYF